MSIAVSFLAMRKSSYMKIAFLKFKVFLIFKVALIYKFILIFEVVLIFRVILVTNEKGTTHFEMLNLSDLGHVQRRSASYGL